MKPLFVVLMVAAIIFAAAKQFAAQFGSPDDFSRRRNIWFVLTAAAFLSPNFWVFAIFAVPLYLWGGLKDSNPVALYLLLFPTIPSVPVNVPIFVAIDNNFLLALLVLIPAWLRRRQPPQSVSKRSLDAMDWTVIAFGVLQTLTFIVPDLPEHLIMTDSVTNCLRRGFFFCTGNLMIYLVASRSTRNIKQMTEIFWSFCLGCLILAAIASFETMRSWYLYSDIAGRWSDDPSYGFYLFRGASLRAKASATTTLELGYLFVIALGFWLFVSTEINSVAFRWFGILLYCLGLLAAYSRGPWIGACIVAFLYLWIRRASLSRLIRLLAIFSISVIAISLTPIGKKIASVIPALGGDVDVGNISYREKLFDRCLDLVKGSPFFGDQWAYFKLEDLRQGQGIIDFVNAYAEEAVFYGLIGSTLLFLPILIGMIRSYRVARLCSRTEPFADIGFCLVACISGTLVMLSGTSFMGDYVILFYLLAGFASAYSVRIIRIP